MDPSPPLPPPVDPTDPIAARAALASREGRYWLNAIGMASATQVFAFLVVVFIFSGFLAAAAILWRMDGVIRGQFDAGLRSNTDQIEDLRKRVEHCEMRHIARDQEDVRSRQREYEREQQMSRERDKLADERKAVADRLSTLTLTLTKLNARLDKD